MYQELCSIKYKYKYKKYIKKYIYIYIYKLNLNAFCIKNAVKKAIK